MKTSLQRVLDSICLTRDEGFRDIDENALEDLLKDFESTDLAESLYQQIPLSIPFEVVCDLFDLLTWRTDDNGEKLTHTTERWLLEGDDQRKVLIALHMDIYPFAKRSEMEKVLTDLMPLDATIQLRCQKLIQERRLLREPD